MNIKSITSPRVALVPLFLTVAVMSLGGSAMAEKADRYTPDNFLIGMPLGDQTTLPFAQLRLLEYSMTVGADAFLAREGRDPQSAIELYHDVTWWPLHDDGTRWEWRHHGMFNVATVKPGDAFVVLVENAPLEAHIAVVPAAKWSGDYARMIDETPLKSRLDPKYDATARLKAFASQPPDMIHMAPAIALMKPFVYWLQMYPQLPPCPDDVIRHFQVALNTQLFDDLASQYPSMHLYKGKTGNHVGLLLENATGDRWYVYAEQGSPQVELLGWHPQQSQQIDQKLRASERWMDLPAAVTGWPRFDPTQL